LSVFSLGGCVVVPTIHGGSKFAPLVDAHSPDAKIRVGTSTRDDVLALLGMPHQPDFPAMPQPDESWQYSDSTTVAAWVFLVPMREGQIQKDERPDCLAIWFDATDHVSEIETWSGYEMPPRARAESNRRFEAANRRHRDAATTVSTSQ
jgi:hypothetical protein